MDSDIKKQLAEAFAKAISAAMEKRNNCIEGLDWFAFEGDMGGNA